jgi:protein O-GlcNAc transferase
MIILSLRRCIALGVLASLFTLSLLGLLFLDVDLPADLHAFKVAALRKLKSDPGNVSADESAIPSGGESLSDLVDDVEGNPIVHPSDSFRSTTGNVQLTSSIQTTIPNGATIHGFTVFDNLVVHNGTFYIVTHNRSAFPEKKEHIVDKPQTKQPVEREPNAEVHRPHSFPFIRYSSCNRIFSLLPQMNLYLFWAILPYG